MKNVIDIILMTCNRLNFLKQCIESFENRLSTPYRLIVINNNSKDGTKEYLEELKEKSNYEVVLFHNDKNSERSIADLNNQGFEAVKSEYFITTMDDIVIPDLKPDVIQQLKVLFDKYPKYGAICLRDQDMKRQPENSDDIIYKVAAVPSFFRIQTKTDVIKMKGFGDCRWEDSEIIRRLKGIGKYACISANLFANNLGLNKDRGYPEWHRESVVGNKKFEWAKKDKPVRPRKEIDTKTNKPFMYK